jgi:hypothetical protein
MTEIAVAINTEIDPPKQKQTKGKRNPKSGAVEKKLRNPPRPHRRLEDDVLAQRIAKLTERLNRTRKQHENTRLLLTKYAHERYFREKDALQAARPEDLPVIEAIPEHQEP